MKTLLLKSTIVLFLMLLFIRVVAQTPQKMSYQAVIRNSANALVTNASVGTRISILQGSYTGTPVYIETHLAPTNANGLLTIQIGGGVVVSGVFSTINWGNGPYFIKTETDPSGGTTYAIVGTTQLLSVPYALYSEKSKYTDCATCNDQFINTVSDTMNGTLTTNDVHYLPPKSFTVTVGEADFQARDDLATVQRGFGSGGAYITNSNSAGLIATVRVPVGAKITNVTYYFYDGTPSENLSIALQANYLNSSYLTVGTVITSGNPGSGTASLSSGLPYTVTGAGPLQLLVLAYNSSNTTTVWPSGSLVIRGARVVYEMTSTQ